MKKMMHIVFIIPALLVWMSCSSVMAYEKEIQGISTDIAGKITASGKKKIAVVDFTDLQGDTTELGRFIAEELSVDLTTDAQKFEVIDRMHLKSLLKEHKLTLSGLLSQETVKEIGQISGVDALVTGTVTPFGDSIRVTCKVIATYSAKVLGAAKADIAKTKTIEELLSKDIDTEAQPDTMKQTQKSNVKTVKVLMKEEANGFVFELQECKSLGSTVTCVFLITNTDDSKKVKQLGFTTSPNDTHIIDGSGNVYGARPIEDIKIANEGFVKNLPLGIPVKTVVKFKTGAPPSLIALLELRGYSVGESIFTVQMYNIPVRSAK